jgi:aminoglycoside phosphotransferase (APT) family kinase protein
MVCARLVAVDDQLRGMTDRNASPTHALEAGSLKRVRSLSQRDGIETWVVQDAGGRLYVVRGLSPLGSPAARERLAHEARVLAALGPAATPFLAADEHDGQLQLIMRFIEGETLAARLARGPLAVKETVRLGRELAAALVLVHGRGTLSGLPCVERNVAGVEA